MFVLFGLRDELEGQLALVSQAFLTIGVLNLSRLRTLIVQNGENGTPRIVSRSTVSA